MAHPEVWLETRQAANALGVTLRALYGLVDAGHVPAHKRDRRLLFRFEDVEAAQETVSATARERGDRAAERRRALKLAGHAAERHETARRSRDAAMAWASREHGASLREIAGATGLSAMTVKRILDQTE